VCARTLWRSRETLHGESTQALGSKHNTTQHSTAANRRSCGRHGSAVWRVGCWEGGGTNKGLAARRAVRPGQTVIARDGPGIEAGRTGTKVRC
jgi:hypothetical protein